MSEARQYVAWFNAAAAVSKYDRFRKETADELIRLDDALKEPTPMVPILCVLCRRPNPNPSCSACPTCIPPDECERPTTFIDQKVNVWSKANDADNGIIRVTFGRITLALSLVEASWLAANIQREIRAVEMTDHERRKLKPGDCVKVRDDGGTTAVYLVESEPWQLGHGAWVIKLKGISGGYSLDRVVQFVEARPRETA